MNSFAKIKNVLSGTWYNSYCSQVVLEVDSSGKITGKYTSHTGSTGTSNIVGFVALVGESQTPVKGIPFAIGINWRIINAPAGSVDGSSHWASTFSGQYHPQQKIVVPNQKPYEIPETLELVNGLLATATTPFNKTSPVMWPQTLRFHKKPPTYCEPVQPKPAIPYQATATDNISGTWNAITSRRENSIVLRNDAKIGIVSGTYYDANGLVYDVFGNSDTITPPPEGSYTVSHQSFSLALRSQKTHELMMITGGVNLTNTAKMFAWSNKLTATTWINRFTQETFDKHTYNKVLVD